MGGKKRLKRRRRKTIGMYLREDLIPEVIEHLDVNLGYQPIRDFIDDREVKREQLCRKICTQIPSWPQRFKFETFWFSLPIEVLGLNDDGPIEYIIGQIPKDNWSDLMDEIDKGLNRYRLDEVLERVFGSRVAASLHQAEDKLKELGDWLSSDFFAPGLL